MTNPHATAVKLLTLRSQLYGIAEHAHQLADDLRIDAAATIDLAPAAENITNDLYAILDAAGDPEQLRAYAAAVTDLTTDRDALRTDRDALQSRTEDLAAQLARANADGWQQIDQLRDELAGARETIAACEDEHARLIAERDDAREHIDQVEAELRSQRDRADRNYAALETARNDVRRQVAAFHRLVAALHRIAQAADDHAAGKSDA